MDGNKCPCCNRTSHLLSTTNEWVYYCPDCDVRFNSKGEVHPSERVPE